MKLCLATTSFPRWVDDHRSPYMLEMARAIERQGHSVRVVTLHYPGARVRENLEGIEVIRTRYLPDQWEILQKEDGGIPVMWRKYPLARLAIIPLVITYMRSIVQYSKDCDLIHANWTLSGMCTWLGQWLHKKTFVVTVHGSDINQGIQIPLARLLTQSSLRASAGVMCVSRSLAEVVLSLGVQCSKVQVVPCGVDTSRFLISKKKRQPFLLFVGALTENKGVRLLLEAFSRVLRSFPEYRLVLVGDGPLRSEFQSLAHSLKVADKVDFLGSIPQVRVSEWMQRARLFVLPSFAEGLPVVLLEALASGTPCIGSHVGGVPDVITEEVGLLVPPADPLALGDAILQILRLEENEYHEMSQRARRRAVEIFDWQVVVPKIISVYTQAVSVMCEMRSL